MNVGKKINETCLVRKYKGEDYYTATSKDYYVPKVDGKTFDELKANFRQAAQRHHRRNSHYTPQIRVKYKFITQPN